MLTALKGSAVRKPLRLFYSLAFFFTWIAWFPQAAYSHGLFPFNHFLFYLLGGIGPMLAAYVVLRVLFGADKAVIQLFQPLWKWQLPLRWYGIILLLVLLLELPSFFQSWGTALSLFNAQSARNTLVALATYTVAAIPEELAWRGFALPRLQQKYSAFTASLIVGVLWAVWHAPLLVNADNVMSNYPLLPWVIDVVMDSIIYVWLYNSTKGSAFLLVLYHALSNTFGGFWGWPSALITTAVALLLLLVYKPATLSANGRKYSPTN